MSLLEVENLHTHFISRTLNDELRVAKGLNGVTFSLENGEIMGLVGETGAGKSLTAMSIMGLLSPPARIVDGSARFDGIELTTMKREELDQLRGNEITMIVQSPVSSLDPLKRIGRQLVRIQQVHQDISKAEAHERAVEMLRTVGIPNPALRTRAWPHELSGGMAQRVLIAMALINSPRLVIADEPTTGLDVTVQAQILDLFLDLVRERGLSAIIITHDLGIVAHYCSKMAVMFAGRVVEQGPVRTVFKDARHPYTRALINSTPSRVARYGHVRSAGGAPPNLYDLPKGCHYRDRCEFSADICATIPPEVHLDSAHLANCHFSLNVPWAAEG
jgi:peptide/nickel transport system ATP-binding protein/oligopeptide transport system ATP-binding protein